MNRNSKSHFSATDNRINIGRSRFDRSSWWKGTMATGSLVPFYIDECLPGDSFDMKTSVLCRMATPLFPVMDNAYLDTYFFFVPNRLVWDHWQEFNGENDLNAWVQTMDYEIPGITFDTVNQVIQTSSTDEASPQGNTAAVSKTVDSFNGFTKSFTEHGFIIGVCCIRTDHTYQNGINRMWSRKDRYDFYWPEFAHIGEQAVLNKEIYFDSDFNGQSNNANAYNNGVFGYQEAWAEYRYRPSFVTGAFRSNYSGGSLDAWHYADDYDSQVYLSGDWIVESPTNVARTLAVTGRQNEQWLLDFYFDLKTTRPMPVYSVPGLVDHF